MPLTSETFSRTAGASVPLILPHQARSGDWLALEKIVLMSEATDLRAGMDTLRTKVIQTFGQVAPHEAYVFLNRTQHLLKLISHDAMGTWLCTRRLHEGRFRGAGDLINPTLSATQLHALVYGLPWQRLGDAGTFRHA
ncbi:hypothetical protein AAEX37_02529 [Oligella sp. MSHR50489EDL]|uniref:IS66 family insertion sequence element accessory protein TnpB n=1 Tax=Oligella sp. MSHR50489EDL TaxID=3139409 RepID=UPI003D813D61